MNVERALVRRMWQTLEPVHAVLYYGPQAYAEAAALGYPVEERWNSYFAWRAAPLGAAGPRLVEAAFYSFSPDMVARYLPAAWRVAEPAAVVEARLRAADRALRDLLGDEWAASPEVAEAAALARRAAEAADLAGRALAAANADLDWPAEPHLVLWQAATILREHRGDGHLAALLAAGLGPCDALVSFAAVGAAPREVFDSREWPETEWAAATARLRERGWVDERGVATEAGERGRAEVERMTDELAAGPWRALGAEDSARLAGLASPVLGAALESGLLPPQNTLGIARPI